MGPKITTNLQHGVDCYLDDNIEYSTLYTIENKENQTPGLVKDFTSCGRNKWCIENKCISYQKSSCSDKCNGKGGCNNYGVCHCDKGYDPPNCEKPSKKVPNGKNNKTKKKKTPDKEEKSHAYLPTDENVSIENDVTSSKKVEKRKDVILMLIIFFLIILIALFGVFVWYKCFGGSKKV